MTNDDVERALDEINDCIGLDEDRFTEWDLEFIDSINEGYSKYGSLTEKQLVVLERIWDKV